MSVKLYRDIVRESEQGLSTEILHSLMLRTLKLVGSSTNIICPLDSYYPARACAARGYVIGRGICCLHFFFWNQSFISHFQRSILTQIGFSSNLMASGVA